MSKQMDAVLLTAKAKLNEHYVNIDTMLSNPRSIPEHIDMVQAIREEIEKANHERDIISTIYAFYDQYPEYVT